VGDGGPATSASLSYASALTVDRLGNLYIAEYFRVRRVTTDGIINTIAGNGLSGFGGDGGPATSAQVTPLGIALDAAGNLYIAESNRVRKVTTDGVIRTVAGTGENAHTGDGGPATAAGIRSIRGLSIDAAGNLYIAELQDHAIRKNHCRRHNQHRCRDDGTKIRTLWSAVRSIRRVGKT
jgi:trimeric autotransporter adhesin